MRSRRSLPVIAAIAALAFAVPAVAAPDRWPGRASYSVPKAKLDAALSCSPEVSSEHEPVLLVHGTGANREANFKWNYWPALQRSGFTVCWVELPRAALGDMQIAAEYVARAVEVMQRRWRSPVDVIGHSQGAVLPRWAIRYFPSGRHVDDWVGLAGPNHGTLVADVSAASGETADAVWQMRLRSRFMAVLNAGDETPGPISYTSIYSAHDELVQPWTTAELRGGRNILIQDFCPGRAVTHVSMLLDAAVYALVLDALTHPGPADPSRAPSLVCFATYMPGAAPAFPGSIPDWSEEVVTSREPPLMPYARRR
jgi:triacylglycerol lipase